MKTSRQVSFGLGLFLSVVAGCDVLEDSVADAGVSSTGGAGGQVGLPGAGTGGSPTGGGAPAVCDVLAAEPNDTAEKAVSYDLGSTLTGCLGAEADIDFYQFTAPTENAAGGHFLISVDQPGRATAVRLNAASDSGEFGSGLDEAVRIHFAGAPGQTYRLAVAK